VRRENAHHKLHNVVHAGEQRCAMAATSATACERAARAAAISLTLLDFSPSLLGQTRVKVQDLIAEVAKHKENQLLGRLALPRNLRTAAGLRGSAQGRWRTPS
jgi:hypothetical protein